MRENEAAIQPIHESAGVFSEEPAYGNHVPSEKLDSDLVNDYLSPDFTHRLIEHMHLAKRKAMQEKE